MFQKHHIPRQLVTILVEIFVTLFLLITPVQFSPTQAESEVSEDVQELEEEAIFEPSNIRVPPRISADGGTRCSPCGEIQGFISIDSGAVTVSEYPTLFWYINLSPKRRQVIHQLEVILMNQSENFYRKSFPAPTEPGIVSFKFPQDELPPIEPGQWYHVFIVAYKNNYEPCNLKESLIQRRVLTPEKQQELDRLTTAEERWNFYAKHHIWSDALSTLYELRRQNPHDEILTFKWWQTLEAIELGKLAEYPLIETVRKKSQDLSKNLKDINLIKCY